MRAVVLVAAVLVLARLHLPGRPPTVCLLRGLTGIPCPFCGGTTAAVDAGSGDLAGAVRASPLAAVGAPLVALAPVLRARLSHTVSRLPAHAGLAALGVALLASELWQLHRFGWI